MEEGTPVTPPPLHPAVIAQDPAGLMQPPHPMQLPQPNSPWLSLAQVDTGARALQDLMEAQQNIPSPMDMSVRQEPSSTTITRQSTPMVSNAPLVVIARPTNPVEPQRQAFRPVRGPIPTASLATTPPPAVFHNPPTPSNMRNSGPPPNVPAGTPMISQSYPMPYRPIPTIGDQAGVSAYHTYVTPLQSVMYPQFAGYPVAPGMGLAPSGMPLYMPVPRPSTRSSPRLVTRGTQTAHIEGNCKHQHLGGPAGSPDTRLRCFHCGRSAWHVDMVTDLNPIRRCRHRRRITDNNTSPPTQNKSSSSDDVIMLDPPVQPDPPAPAPPASAGPPQPRRYVTATTVRIPRPVPSLSPSSIMVDPQQIFRMASHHNLAVGVAPAEPNELVTGRRPRNQRRAREPAQDDSQSHKSPDVTYL